MATSVGFMTPPPSTPPQLSFQLPPPPPSIQRSRRRRRNGTDVREDVIEGIDGMCVTSVSVRDDRETDNNRRNRHTELNRMRQRHLRAELAAPPLLEDPTLPTPPQSKREIAIQCWKGKWEKFLREPNDTVHALREQTTHLPYKCIDTINVALYYHRIGISLTNFQSPFLCI